ncbi:MAG: amidohydrolase family protein, partial [Ktedonobacteraceae bacterium]
MRFTLRGARLVDATMDIASGDITINGDRIENVGEIQNIAHQIIDATDTIIMPGFIEVHTHGGGKHSLHTTDVQEISAYMRWIPSTGVTSFLIGVLGTPIVVPEPQLATSVVAIESYGNALGAEPLGIHLEGPYISEKRRGAHAPSWLRKPNEAEIERIIALTKGYLRLITVAPELPGAPAMIRRLVEAG